MGYLTSGVPQCSSALNALALVYFAWIELVHEVEEEKRRALRQRGIVSADCPHDGYPTEKRHVTCLCEALL